MQTIESILQEENAIRERIIALECRQSELTAQASQDFFSDDTSTAGELALISAKLAAVPAKLAELANCRQQIELNGLAAQIPKLFEMLEAEMHRQREFRLWLHEVTLLHEIGSRRQSEVANILNRLQGQLRLHVSSMMACGLSQTAANEYRQRVDVGIAPITAELETLRKQVEARFNADWGIGEPTFEQRANIIPPAVEVMPEGWVNPTGNPTWPVPRPNEQIHVSNR